jgi:hypothetical protein
MAWYFAGHCAVKWLGKAASGLLLSGLRVGELVSFCEFKVKLWAVEKLVKNA